MNNIQNTFTSNQLVNAHLSFLCVRGSCVSWPHCSVSAQTSRLVSVPSASRLKLADKKNEETQNGSRFETPQTNLPKSSATDTATREHIYPLSWKDNWSTLMRRCCPSTRLASRHCGVADNEPELAHNYSLYSCVLKRGSQLHKIVSLRPATPVLSRTGVNTASFSQKVQPKILHGNLPRSTQAYD